jgi:chloramphenicol 3-O phosphotransferase
MKHNYQIIYLNGPSSAGKSTLARALQNKLSQPFLVLGIDQIIFMMPEKLNDWTNYTLAPGFSWQPVKNAQEMITAYKIVTGPFGIRMTQALKDIAIALATTEHYLIIDDVSFGNEQVAEWRKALHAFTVLWIGVTAPVSILEQREKERGDRKIGSAQWQAEHVHTDVCYDLMIDTSVHTIDEHVNTIMRYGNF